MESFVPDWLKLVFMGVVAMGVSACLVAFRVAGRNAASA